ncbi:hypothetical protein V8E52_005030 [Russula decolorans]
MPYTITSLHEPLEQPTQGNNRMRTIDILPDNVLLETFDLYRLDAVPQSGGRPWKWHRLAHVCQKWRHIISTSPRRLDLRILCDNRTPIEILHVWPTLPLAVSFKATQKSTLIPKHITAAFRHLDRICQLELYVTSSMTISLAEMIQKPCQALQSVSITVDDATGASIPVCNAFLGGSAPHLEEIKLDGISYPFPRLRQVLLSTHNLVELRLSKIPNALYFSPEDLVTGLSPLVRLKSLSVGFYFTAFHPPPNATHTPQRTTLPSLTSLDFHGSSEYLEEFMARINSPALYKITIRLFNQISFENPQFCQFILRPNALGSPTWVIVTHSAESVSVSLILNEQCVIGTSCRRLDWQLSFVTEILTQLSPLLSSVRSLTIQKSGELPSMEDMESAQWLELFRPFTHVTLVRVSEEQLVPSIVQALVTEDMATTVLPELFSLHLEEHSATPSVVEAAKQFVAMRRLSGHTVFLSG